MSLESSPPSKRRTTLVAPRSVPLSLHLRAVLLSLGTCFVAGGCASTASPQAAAVRPGPNVTNVSSWSVIGESQEGRAVRALTVGDGPHRIALIAGIHGDEGEGRRHVAEVVETLSAAAAGHCIRVIEDVNPDGSAAVRRTTSAGVDPNRNWPSANFVANPRHGTAPLSEPAIAAACQELVSFDPELVIVFHSTPRGPFVNFDGPAEAEAQSFASGAGAPWQVVPSMGYPTPGSLGSWMGVDRGVPILTIEFERGSPASESGPALRRGLHTLLTGGRWTNAAGMSPGINTEASTEFRVR